MASNAKEIQAKILSDTRPWGNFRRFAFNEQCTVKILTVKPNQQLSKQSHQNRDELWVVLDRGLKIELDGQTFNPEPGEEFVISRNTKHRLSSNGTEGRVLEVSFGYFDENDINRFEDIYGRK